MYQITGSWIFYPAGHFQFHSTAVQNYVRLGSTVCTRNVWLVPSFDSYDPELDKVCLVMHLFNDDELASVKTLFNTYDSPSVSGTKFMIKTEFLGDTPISMRPA